MTKRERRLVEFETTVRATRAAVKQGDSYIVMSYTRYLDMKSDAVQLRRIAAMTNHSRPRKKGF